MPPPHQVVVTDGHRVRRITRSLTLPSTIQGIESFDRVVTVAGHPEQGITDGNQTESRFADPSVRPRIPPSYAQCTTPYLHCDCSHLCCTHRVAFITGPCGVCMGLSSRRSHNPPPPPGHRIRRGR
jgi:hypothetical protein